MKGMIFLIGLCVLGSNVYASCEEGPAMAEEAAVKAASVKSRGCVSDSRSSRGSQVRDVELWTVAVKCRSFIGRTIYHVSLLELEDAVCRVQKVNVVNNEEQATPLSLQKVRRR